MPIHVPHRKFKDRKMYILKWSLRLKRRLLVEDESASISDGLARFLYDMCLARCEAVFSEDPPWQGEDEDEEDVSGQESRMALIRVS